MTWDVNGVVGGNATVGSILNSQTDPDSTTYSAPLSHAGGRIGDRARAQQRRSERFRQRNDHIHGIYST